MLTRRSVRQKTIENSADNAWKKETTMTTPTVQRAIYLRQSFSGVHFDFDKLFEQTFSLHDSVSAFFRLGLEPLDPFPQLPVLLDGGVQFTVELLKLHLLLRDHFFSALEFRLRSDRDEEEDCDGEEHGDGEEFFTRGIREKRKTRGGGKEEEEEDRREERYSEGI